MTPEKKRLRVGVLFGGRSGEHEVSLASAASVIRGLDPDKYEPVPIGISKEGHWLIGSVDWYIVGGLLIGSLPGISIGSQVAARISDRFLLPVLASILVLIGLRLITS